MTKEEIIRDLKAFSDARYPKINVVRDETLPGTSMKDFIEGLKFKNQKQDRILPS